MKAKSKLFPKMSQKALKEALKNVVIPQHTKDCTYYIVGGFKHDSNDHSSPKQKWNCSKDCPLKK